MNEDKKKLHMEKQQFSLKNMYFNRYLIVRYLTALFFYQSLLADLSVIVKKYLALAPVSVDRRSDSSSCGTVSIVSQASK